MTCPACQSEAVVETPMRNAQTVPTWRCAGCGHGWSHVQCQTRNCSDPALSMCVECAKYRCRGHGPGNSGVCSACVKRTASLLKPANRRTSWNRTTPSD